MKNNKELINFLIVRGYLKTNSIINSFKAIDRADFVLEEYKDKAYENYPLPIGFNQTISQPSTVAFMIELLNPQKKDKILDVGSGSGWTTALLAKISKKVIGVELIFELVCFGQANLNKYSFKNAEIIQASEKLGYEKEAPFDKILISAESREIPFELLKQLREEGEMVIPIKESILKIKRKGSSYTILEKFDGFAFVPLKY